MDIDDILVLVGCLILPGVLIIGTGIIIWIGYSKAWFIIERVPVIVPTAFYNGSVVFLGLSLIFLAVAGAARSLNLFYALPCPTMALAIILAIWQPKWIQPAWYRWLEKNHEAIIPILKDEVRQMGYKKWKTRVSTQEGLEQWVEEVRRKRGLV